MGTAVLEPGERGAVAVGGVALTTLWLRSTTYYNGVVEGDLYDGVPVDRLPIDAVDVPDQAHLQRSDRYRGAVDI